MNLAGLNTTSLKEHSQGERVLRILSAALSAVEPGRAITQHLKREGNWLLAGSTRYNLTEFRRVRIVGMGKAALPMTRATSEVLGGYLSGGVVVTKFGHLDESNLPSGIQFFKSSHPVPDHHSIAAATRDQGVFAGWTSGRSGYCPDLRWRVSSAGRSSTRDYHYRLAGIDAPLACMRCGYPANQLSTETPGSSERRRPGALVSTRQAGCTHPF